MVSELTLAVARCVKHMAGHMAFALDVWMCTKRGHIHGHFPICLCSYTGKLDQRGRQVLFFLGEGL